MKKYTIFKVLIDILFYILCLGLILIVLILPISPVESIKLDIKGEVNTVILWSIIITGILSYLIFLKGIYFLRNVAKLLLPKHYFSAEIIDNIRKSGNHFLSCGIGGMIILKLLWLNKLIAGKLTIGLNSNLLLPLFLMIIGLFFIIQSNALLQAKRLKEENDLTV